MGHGMEMRDGPLISPASVVFSNSFNPPDPVYIVSMSHQRLELPNLFITRCFKWSTECFFKYRDGAYD